MKSYSLAAIAIALLGMILTACDSESADSRVEHQGLVVTFTPVCIDGDIGLRGEIFNSGTKSVQIESGSLPWHYDLVGTDFRAESGGESLIKNTTTPLIGKTGPKVLAPNERREGVAHIGFIFPELKALLAKQPVTVTWSYPLTSRSRDPDDQMTGSVEITKDPCAG